MDYKAMFRLGKFAIGECQGDLWCSYDKDCDVTGFYLSRPELKKNDLFEIDQHQIIDWLIDEYDNESTRADILEQEMDEAAYDDFEKAHSARRLG